MQVTFQMSFRKYISDHFSRRRRNIQNKPRHCVNKKMHSLN